MPSINDAVTEEEYVSALVADAAWRICYHEQSLSQAHLTLAVVKEIIMRGFTEIDLAAVNYGDVPDEPTEAANASEYIRATLWQAICGIEYHETELGIAHRGLAHATAVVLRGKYAIDITQIKKEQAERLAKSNEKDKDP